MASRLATTGCTVCEFGALRGGDLVAWGVVMC